MSEKTTWARRPGAHGSAPIRTADIGACDPCDGWPLVRWMGIVYQLTYIPVVGPGGVILGYRVEKALFQ